jgi:3-methylfumaryl-CoA hydratase
MTHGEVGEHPAPETESDLVPAGAARALHNLLDAPGPPPASGDPLPPLWHWLAFLPRTPQEDLGPDGHPQLGSSTRREAFPRRMFAGARLWFPGIARIDRQLVRQSDVVSTTEKSGRSGPLLFVTIEHRVASEEEVVVREDQDIVYRPSQQQGTPQGEEPVPPMNDWTWGLDLHPSETMLFRFSALTYNAHRIHYDRQYAREVEGYPGLVVQGPLQAIALAEVCRRDCPDRRMTSFDFRALRPAFEGATLNVRGRPNGSSADLAVFDGSGRRTMEATATLEP